MASTLHIAQIGYVFMNNWLLYTIQTCVEGILSFCIQYQPVWKTVLIIHDTICLPTRSSGIPNPLITQDNC